MCCLATIWEQPGPWGAWLHAVGAVCWIKENRYTWALVWKTVWQVSWFCHKSRYSIFFHHTSETRASFFDTNLILHKKPVRIPLLYSLLIWFSKPCSLDGKFIFLWFRMVLEGILRDNTFVLKGCACLHLFPCFCGFLSAQALWSLMQKQGFTSFHFSQSLGCHANTNYNHFYGWAKALFLLFPEMGVTQGQTGQSLRNILYCMLIAPSFSPS